MDPVLIRCKDALYPDFARSAGVEGSVRVMSLVGLDGHVERVVLQKRESVPMLDESAITAARTCVYRPPLSNGRPVKVWVLRPYRFSLH